MSPRPAVAFVAGVLAMTVVAAGSRLPHAVHPGDEGLVRLSWRVGAAAAGPCRPPSPEELEALPIHMRNPDACRGQGVAYRLRARIDGATVLDRIVHPSGARGDRPIYVFEEFVVAPGVRDLRVAFTPTGADGSPHPEDPDPSAGEENTAPDGGGPPSSSDPAGGFVFERPVTVEPRGVVLVTLGRDSEGRPRVEARTAPPP